MSESQNDFLERIGVTSSPSTTTEISIDVTPTDRLPNPRLLGKMVFTEVEEEGRKILALGQVTFIETRNRWHEDPAFKGVIKQQGRIPNLSGTADTRLAKINVQSCFECEGQKIPTGHVLSLSPSTGQEVKKMNDAFMRKLVKGYGEAIQYIGTVYGSEDVNMPMWFRHFGKPERDEDYTAVGDALHIGVFGKTGSGKTVMSSLMLLSYAKNKKMNILVFDPQGQFYKDKDLLPSSQSLEKAVNDIGIRYKKYKLNKDISLPADDFELFGSLLLESGYIRQAFNLTTDDKKEDMKRLIMRYLFYNKSIHSIKDFKLKPMLDYLEKNVEKIYKNKNSSYYNSLRQYIQSAQNDKTSKKILLQIYKLFTEGSKNINQVIEEVVSHQEQGNFIIIDTSLSDKDTDKYQPLFLELIEKTIVKQSEELYSSGDKLANALIVMDEAHRFISKSHDSRLRDLTRNIVDAVRTTRKYGVGHMFITQTIESLDNEIVKQLRIHVFGYGLTTGGELMKIKDTINSGSALNLYKSFIDPSNTKKYPFMFLGAVSPLSLSGSPLFIEAYNKFEDYEKNNRLNSTDKDQ